MATFSRSISTAVLRLLDRAPPERCDTLAHVTLQAGGVVRVRSPAMERTNELPVVAQSDMLEFLRGHARVVSDEELVCTIPNGRLAYGGIVLGADGRAVARDVSIVFGPTRDDDHPLLHASRLPRLENRGGKVLNVATNGGNSYYHWLLEELPRLIEGASGRPDTVVAHRGHTLRAARALGCTATLVDAASHLHSRCAELVVGHLHGPCGFPSELGVALVHDFAARFAPSPRPPARIYVSRADAPHRRIRNEGALWSALEERGFVRVELDRMPWEDQIATFKHAKVVVASHGAGLANLVFCAPGTLVVELFHRRYVHWCYWHLANARRLDYRPIVEPGDTPLCHDLTRMGEDIDIPPAAVVAGLRD